VYGEDARPAADGSAYDRIACTASDDGSGLRNAVADAGFELTAALPYADAPAEAAAVPYAVHDDVCDNAGNCAPVPVPDPVKIDRKPPTASCGSLPDAPAGGWYRDNPTIDCSLDDAGSGLADAAQSRVTVTTNVAAGDVDADAASGTTAVCDAVGNCAELPALTGLRVDRAAPIVSCTAPASWTKGASAHVECTANDQEAGSGLADPSDSRFTLDLTIDSGSEVAGVALPEHQVCDVAGNCAEPPSLAGAGLDDRAPSVSCAPSPTGWQNADVTVHCTASDGGSGLASPGDAAFDLSTAFTGSASGSVPFQMTKTQVCDAAGNCADVPAPAPVKIDRVFPKADCTRPVDGEYTFNVSVSCTVMDGDAGLARGASLDLVLRTAVTPGTSQDGAQTTSREVCDLAGNCMTFGPYGDYDIDLTVPPAVAAPAIDAPGAVTVLAAVRTEGFTGIAVPFAAPTVTSSIGAVIDCEPDDSGVYPLGTTTVRCSARDSADRVVDARFPVRVTAAPELAATEPIPADGTIPVAGSGFTGTVGVEIDGLAVTRLDPVSGAVAADVPVPASVGAGEATVVLRGTGGDGEPLLVVKPVTITAPVGGGDTPGGGGDGGSEGGPGDGGAAGLDGPGDGVGVGSGADDGAGAGLGDDSGDGVVDSPADDGWILDPDTWPSQQFEDGGQVNTADGNPYDAGPASPLWWLIPIAVLLVAGSAAAATWIRRRSPRG